jgi:urease accessory protein
MNSSALLILLQWMDSAFPTGAFAHSHALETFVQAGTIHTLGALQAAIAQRVRLLATNDLLLVKEAWYQAKDGELPQLIRLDQLCAASKTARETREASEKVGRRMLDNVWAQYPQPIIADFRQALAAQQVSGHHCVVYGLCAQAAGIGLNEALHAFGYGVAANQASAALKLLPIGPAQAQRLIAESHPHIQQAAEHALSLSLADFAGFAPALDIRSMQHEALFRRLFIS